MAEDLMKSSIALHGCLSRRSLRPDGSLRGPDPGVRLNLRVGRFVKSYLGFVPWRDDHYYLQAQAYWVFDNLDLYKATGDRHYLDLATDCAEVVKVRQTVEGYWEYPNAEWSGRVATVEGCFGALALLAAWRASGDESLLVGARRWYSYMVDHVGFQPYGDDGLAVNYFSNVGRGLVPNNSTLALWLAAELQAATGDTLYSEHIGPMVRFISKCPLPTGELPYVIGSGQGPGRDHYLCFQYNAYQFLDLVEYRRITGDSEIEPVLVGLSRFLAGGVTPSGAAKYNCDKPTPEMSYFTSAVAAALLIAARLGFGDVWSASTRAYSHLLSLQGADGGFDYSIGDHGFLRDRRRYPRNQSMILRHLLIGASSRQP